MKPGIPVGNPTGGMHGPCHICSWCRWREETQDDDTSVGTNRVWMGAETYTQVVQRSGFIRRLRCFSTTRSGGVGLPSITSEVLIGLCFHCCFSADTFIPS